MSANERKIVTNKFGGRDGRLLWREVAYKCYLEVSIATKFRSARATLYFVLCHLCSVIIHAIGLG